MMTFLGFLVIYLILGMTVSSGNLIYSHSYREAVNGDPGFHLFTVLMWPIILICQIISLFAGFVSRITWGMANLVRKGGKDGRNQ